MDVNKTLRRLPLWVQHIIFNTDWIMKVAGEEFWSLHNMDRELCSSEFGGKQGGFFIEIGANNGVAQSNTKHFELFHNWRGILVEPHPGNFERLRVTRRRSTIAVNAACVSFDYPRKIVDLYYSNLLTIADGLDSDKSDPENWARGAEFLLPQGEKVYKFSAPAKTLHGILVEFGAPRKIDFFSLDVEGAEIEVLKGIDYTLYNFSNILVESDAPHKIIDFLASKGYRLSRKLSEHDYLFQPSSS